MVIARFISVAAFRLVPVAIARQGQPDRPAGAAVVMGRSFCADVQVDSAVRFAAGPGIDQQQQAKHTDKEQG